VFPELAELLAAIVAALDAVDRHPALSGDPSLRRQVGVVREAAGKLALATGQPTVPQPSMPPAGPLGEPGSQGDF
jgi:hypothetical protein